MNKKEFQIAQGLDDSDMNTLEKAIKMFANKEGKMVAIVSNPNKECLPCP